MLYIHQFPDWTNFRYDSKRVLDALGRTRLLEGKLLGLAQLCDIRQLEIDNLTSDITANYEIDGQNLNADQVKKEVELRGQGTQNFIKNYLGALQNSATTLTAERLFNWHAAMSQNKAMQFRNEDSEIVKESESRQLHFIGPHPERLANEVTHFIKWFETVPMDGAIKAAIAHFWFLTLRPFSDANGRIARTITALQLARAENTTRCQYSLNKQISGNKSDYFRILCKTQGSNGDLTEWILWFLKMMEQAICESIEILSAQVKQFAMQQKFTKAELTPRETRLVKAAMNGELPADFTAKDVAALIEASHDTALREIQSLMEKGILQSNKKRGRSQSYSLL